MTKKHSDTKGQQDRGQNLGQGLANIPDEQRRALAGTGDDAPTQDQRRPPRSPRQDSDAGERSGR